MNDSPDKSPQPELPPHSDSAEQGVLACVLQRPDCIAECIETLPGPEVFFNMKHLVVYSAMLKLFDARKPIDTVTLYEHLKLNQTIEGLGGVGYIGSLPDQAATSANLPEYLEILRQKFILRRLLHTCIGVSGRVHDVNGDFQQFIEATQASVLRLLETSNCKALRSAKSLVAEAIDDIERSFNQQGVIGGLETGFRDFDRLTDGLHPGDMVIIAGRPSCGKSAIAMNIAEHVAVDLRQPVGVFSLEMTATSLMKRVLCSRAKVNLRDVRDGRLRQADFTQLTNASAKLSASPLYIDDSSGLSILQLRARARRLHQQHGLKLLVIDYLQLLNASGGSRRSDNRQQEVSDISAGVKCLAKDLNLPVIVLSQLNRSGERERTQKPRLSSLRESGSIENDCDIAALLYRAGKEDDDDAFGDVVATNLLIAKNRNGGTGEISLTFFRSHTRFESAARITEADIPSRYTQQSNLPYKG